MDLQQKIEDLISSALSERCFPGIVLIAERRGLRLLSHTAGRRQTEPSAEVMTEDTIFDLASMTKPLATAILTMRLLETEGISIDRPLGSFLPEVAEATRSLALRSLLLHTSGLPATPGIYTKFASARQDRELARSYLYSVEPVAPEGRQVIYACTGYLFLGEVLRRCTGRGLGELFHDWVAAPLGLEDLLFSPPVELRPRVAPTEHCAFRGRWIRGEVHDENAWCMGGEAGNAGLFGSAAAVARLAGLFLHSGAVDGIQVLRPESVALMTTCGTTGFPERRSCGFMMGYPGCAAGPLAGAFSFGHTGFTGTSLWIDPERELIVVALTNRVHYGREQTAEAIRAFRRALHGEIFRALGMPAS